MSREDIVAVASRLFAMFLILTAIKSATASVGTMLAAHEDWVSLLYASPVVILCVLAAFLLWNFPLSIARTLLPVMRDSGPPIATGTTDIQALALAVLGIWVLAESISNLAYWVAIVQFKSAAEYSAGSLTRAQKASVVRDVLECVLGLILVFGSRGLSAMLYRLLYGSIQPSAPEA